MKKGITKRAVDALKPGEIIADYEPRGFVARCLPSGLVSYGFRYRSAGKRHWLALGLHGNITPDAARRLAKRASGKVAAGRDPRAELLAERAKAKAARTSTVNAVLDAFVERHVRKNLRSAREVERCFNVYVRPRIGDTSIYELRRSDIMKMLDEIAGDVMADRVLAHLRKCFNWQMARDDGFNSPITKGMARTKPSERARDRKLSDEELRDLWRALGPMTEPACFPKLVKTLLLTAQRRDDMARMRWEEIEGDASTIPGKRYKTKRNHLVPLTDAARALLGEPKKRGFVFSTDGGKRAFSGFSKAKAALVEAVDEARKRDGREPMPHWQLRDLRRTARSLMSRAGVTADIGERVLGHKIPGVRGVYDRHEYEAEKRDALERLSGLVARIVEPKPPNVVPFPATA